jgi:hypothetical protein
MVKTETQTAIVDYFQRKIQLSGFSAYSDGLPYQLFRRSGVLLYVFHLVADVYSINRPCYLLYNVDSKTVVSANTILCHMSINTSHSSPNTVRVIRSKKMGVAGHLARRRGKNMYRVLVGKPQGEIPHKRPRRRWDFNVKMALKEAR